MMNHTHYPTTSGGRNRFLDSIGSADVSQGGHNHPNSRNRRQMNKTVNYEHNSPTDRHGQNSVDDDLESNFAGSRFVTQRKIDPQSVLPPYSLSVRDNSDKLRKDLTFP